jgi:hypothetical protein
MTNDQHLVLDKRPLRDLYVTLLNGVYGLDIGNFGQNLTGAPATTIVELLRSS